jgi:hypothetical protein
MSKKLLVAVFVLSFLLALSNAAFAFKDPNHIKPLPNTLPSAPKATAEMKVAYPETPPQYSKPASAAQRAFVTGTAYRAPVTCQTLSYWDGTPYWFWTVPDAYGDDYFNMKFTPVAGETCTLTTVALGFYEDESVVMTGDGLDVVVWDDDGFGFPGTERARITVPAASMVWYPSYVVVNFRPNGLVYLDQDFHVGFTTRNQAGGNVYALLSDEGTTGTNRSSEFYLGLWGTMYNDWGVDVNFVIEADICFPGGGPQGCTRQQWGTFEPYYYWTIPDNYGDDLFNVRFSTGNNPSYLKTAFLNFYEAGSVDVTGEGIIVYVWDDDGSGFPGLQRASVQVSTAQMAWLPDELTIDMTSLNITFPPNSEFHIGYTTVNQGAGNVMACLSDDGSGAPTYRSSEDYAGIWGTMYNDWGLDVDFMFAAEICYEQAEPENCYELFYFGDPWYYWTIPDAYGDDYFNTRFTHVDDDCRLIDLNIMFYGAATVGNPGADYILFNSDGTYPTDTIAVYSVNPVTQFIDVSGMFETIDIEGDNLVLNGDYHLGYTPIYNDPGDVLAVISDDGSTATGRSSEYYGGGWGLMVDDWGVDVCFMMLINICCPEPDGLPCVAETDWPTLNHDYARTGYSKVEIGDLCGFQKIWDYWSPYDFCYYANPTIMDEKVYIAMGVHLVCLTVQGDGLGGPVEVWNTDSADPIYATILGGQIRTSPTIDDGVVFFGAGTYQGFVAANANTGAAIWYRSPLTANPLEGTSGNMRFCASVVLNDVVYFGGDGGRIYGLDRFTGVTLYHVPTPYGRPIWVSMSSDGTDLYISCSAALTGGDAGSLAAVGGIYKYTPALAIHPSWLYGGFSGLLGWDEGSTNGATYSALTNMLYTVLLLDDHTSFDGYDMIIDAATGDPATGNYWLSGQGFYGNIALVDDMERFYYSNVPNKDARFSGIWCRSYDNNTVWQDFTKGQMTSPAGLTCDPYVFWGTRNLSAGASFLGGFHCSDAATGATYFTYNLTGYGFGPAIAKYDDVPYVAHSQIFSDCGTGGGRLTMYSQGDPRPRLVIPSHEVIIDPPLEFTDPAGTTRTLDDAFCNGGCVGLNYCLQLEADPSFPLGAFVSTVNPRAMNRASKVADQIVEYSINDFNAMDGWKAARMSHTPALSEYPERAMGKQSVESRSAGAPPSWVTLASASSGILNGEDCYDATFAFNVPVMGRGENWFYMLIGTDDPDYNECPATGQCGGLDLNDAVHIAAVKGYSFCDGYITFGDGNNQEYVNNGGWFDDGTVTDAFLVGAMDDPLYQGSFWWGLYTNRLAWLEEGGEGYNHFFPDSPCDLQTGVLFDSICNGSGGWAPIIGDYFEAAVIDSIFDYDSGLLDDTLTIGMRMVYREYGAYSVAGTDAEAFDNFKLVAYTFTNRNAAPVADLYWGMFADFDMPGDAGGYEQGEGNVAAAAVYQFNSVSNEQAGYGSLPLAGSSLDGVTLTPGLYNGYIISNPDEVYSPAILPQTFMPTISGVAQGTIGCHPNACPGMPEDDRGMILTAAKKTFAGNEVAEGAFVVFGFPTGSTSAELEDLMGFANKWAGYGRGDLNNDGVIDLLDMCFLVRFITGNGPAPCPFVYLADVNVDGVVDGGDATYMYNYLFNNGPLPMSKLVR